MRKKMLQNFLGLSAYLLVAAALHECPNTSDYRYNADTHKCYFKSTAEMTWNDAKQHCQQILGDSDLLILTSLDVDAERALIYNFLNNNTMYWLGGQYCYNQFKWCTRQCACQNKEIISATWAAGQPSSDPDVYTKKVAAIKNTSGSAYLKSLHQDETQKYICHKQAYNGGCNDVSGYDHFTIGSTCYYFSIYTDSWWSAIQKCYKFVGGSLVFFDSALSSYDKSEIEAVMETGTTYWVGGKYCFDKFRWCLQACGCYGSEKININSFLWSSGGSDPPKQDSDMKVGGFLDTSDLKIDAVNGTEELPFVCEMLLNDCDSSPCHNGGTCSSSNGGREHSCNCKPGYNGTWCETEIGECESNPCLNNGTCNDLVNSYNCTCQETENEVYYGIHCNKYCENIKWSAWSSCSNLCDYGVRSRFRNHFTDLCAYEKQFEPCNTMYCREHVSAEKTVCESKNGFYSKSACFFLAESSGSLNWEGLFSLCESNGAKAAHLYDSKHLSQRVMSYLLSKHPNEAFWLALKQSGTEINWMSASNTQTVPLVRDWLDMIPSGEKCIQIRTSTFVQSSEKDFFDETKSDCEGSFTTTWALCMINLKYADFEKVAQMKVETDQPNMISNLADVEDSWWCGLKCRRWPACQGYNYKSTTKECQLLRVKSSALKGGTMKRGSSTVTMYNEVRSHEWDHYKRIY